ncbi:regulating synaptic membrane exocytosis protein 2 isoform X1, partial [Vespula squamosa]
TKLAPAKVTPVEEIQPKEDTIDTIINKLEIDCYNRKPEAGSKTSSGEECRVCRKSFGPEEASRTCCECQHKVCEDCASYSTTTNSDDQSSWRCSVCRRKIASRDQPIVTQESTDSLLEVPILEALQRRHSDARLGCQSGSQLGSIGSGLAPPRSPELRRHSDVSPASLKELEKFRKVAGEQRREDLKWERDLDRKSKSRGGSPDRHQVDRGRGTSPQRIVKSSQPTESDMAGSGDLDDEEERRRRARRSSSAVRRKSFVTRQRSYDDEIKPAGTMAGSSSQSPHPDTGLGLPIQLPRRASAYDVYTPPGSAGLNAAAIASAQQRASISAQGVREPEDRPITRRASFRSVKPMLPYEVGAEEEIMNMDQSVSVVQQTITQPPVLIPDEERRSRRRGSQLPDINAIRALTSAPGSVKAAQPAAVSRVTAEERDLPRQGSLVDGEGIKIVIHDVDSDLVPRVNTNRRVKLRRDPVMDKGHRTRGFGMRVVGGKTGADGRTFSYIVWTVPGGPAEKAGLQQGDKVLEWSGVSLIDKSFEEVAQIIERTDDFAELVVEHATDIVGDLLDDPGMISSGKTSNMGLLMGNEKKNYSKSRFLKQRNNIRDQSKTNRNGQNTVLTDAQETAKNAVTNNNFNNNNNSN